MITFPFLFDQVFWARCFQLKIRRFLSFRFVPVEFDLSPFQLSVPEISRAFLEGPHNDKEASTFVLVVSSFLSCTTFRFLRLISFT